MFLVLRQIFTWVSVIVLTYVGLVAVVFVFAPNEQDHLLPWLHPELFPESTTDYLIRRANTHPDALVIGVLALSPLALVVGRAAVRLLRARRTGLAMTR